MVRATLNEQLAAFAHACQYETLPAAVSASVRQRVLDSIGICLAARDLETSRGVLAYLEDQGGRGDARIIGSESAVPAAQAAFGNGVLAHSLDYDDTHLPSILHPSATVVPAALAAAEKSGATGAELVAGIAVGLEICVRLGMAGYDVEERNSLFFDRGQHATSICGALGGAAAAAKILGGTEADIGNSMAVVASMASGIIEANRTGGNVKRIHCGWAAHAAVSSAELVLTAGITGPPTVLEGRFGLFQCFLDGRFDRRPIEDGLGSAWSVPDIHFKPYPANHFTHTAADAAIRLRDAGLQPADIDSIRIGVATATIRTIGEPIDVKRTPRTGYQAQFSGPYVVAAALMGGRGLGLGLADFTDELARDPGRRAVMARTVVEGDQRCDEVYPDEFPCVLRVTTVDGSTLHEEVWANRGGPARPLSEEELTTKYRENVSASLSLPAAADVEREILTMDASTDVRGLMALTRRGSTPEDQT